MLLQARSSYINPSSTNSSNTTRDSAAERGGPSPGWVNGTHTPPSDKQVGVGKAETYSAGDYYAAPTTTAESTMAFPTDTSKVSVTSASLPPAMTDIAEKEVHNGASSVASTGSLVSVLAALSSFSWLF